MSVSLTTSKGRTPGLQVPIERYDLACGARLCVSPRAGAPVTAVRVHVRGGPSLDAEGKEGTATLTGALVDQGTRDYDDKQLAELLEPAGGNLSGSATGLSGQIAGTEWKLLLKVLAAELVTPTYPAKKIEVQKRRLLDRLRVEREDPRAQAGQRFRRLVYGGHWMGNPHRGTVESVSAITAADLRRHHRKNWVASRATIAVCGDVKPLAVKRYLDGLLSDWKSGADLVTTPPEFPAPGRRIDVFRADRQQVHVYLGHLGITRRDPDYPSLVVMDHVLGTGPGFTNRISRRLRDEQGLAYSVHADISGSAGRLPGTFTAYIGTSPEHLGTAVGGFLEEMRRIREEQVAAQELELAKSYLLGSFLLGFERASQRAAYMVNAEVHGFPDDYLEQLPERYASVDVEEVQRVAQRHLKPDACCLSVSGPVDKKTAEQALAKR